MISHTSSRIPSLDGLRTISIALVIASHLAFSFGHFNLFNAGDLGVRIFFVISGFLITGLLAAEHDRSDGINLMRFYFRRTLRIFPPYYFLLFILLIFSVLGKIHLTLTQFVPVLSYVSDTFFRTTGISTMHGRLPLRNNSTCCFPGSWSCLVCGG